ncbi:MAG TPA: Hsp70 family protein [Polyangiaceae bacterium]|jgi:molecular chaperone DnaK|nr:Hsp70 family protein [Polyangiaceae bacterium]
MAPIIGIDLGTTNSLVAHLEGGRPEIIPNAAGQRSTPSVVGLDREDRLHVGATAKNQLLVMPERTIAEVKRLMGTSDKVTLGSRSYTPTEISGVILRSLKEDAEKHLGQRIEEAVVTVPAYFTDAQRQATKDAGELAGMRVERILNEPTAAALAYGLDNLDKEQYVLVYDLGGGTFDVSVLEMFNGVLDVKASAGNNRLGGGDIDRALMGYLCDEFEKAHGINIRGDAQAMARVRASAEQAKIELSTARSAAVMLPFLAVKGTTPISFEATVSRDKLEALVQSLIRSTLGPIDSALADAKLDRSQIAEVVLVGGASRMPMVQALVAEHFGKEPRRGVNPDEAVALGAAIQAGLKAGAISAQTGIMITDVCPFTLGVEVMAQAGRQKVQGLFSPIIPRNSTIPVSRTETYSTTGDGQRQVTIRVYQGESRLVKDNIFLDAYTVEGVPPGPAGSEQVKVTFTYDINGILKVTTKVVSTGKEATMLVDKSPNRMSDADREAAKGRLEREWGSAAGEGEAAVPGASAAAKGAALQDDRAELIAAARKKRSSVKGDVAARLADLADRLETAVREGDATVAAKLDTELTDLLFELD